MNQLNRPCIITADAISGNKNFPLALGQNQALRQRKAIYQKMAGFNFRKYIKENKKMNYKQLLNCLLTITILLGALTNVRAQKQV